MKPHANGWGMLGASTHSLWWHKGGSPQILPFTWPANLPDELWERGSGLSPCCEPMRSWASQMNARIKCPQLELFGAQALGKVFFPSTLKLSHTAALWLWHEWISNVNGAAGWGGRGGKARQLWKCWQKVGKKGS